jgi:hypothetical protein
LTYFREKSGGLRQACRNLTALLAALGQLLLDNEQQCVIYQRRIGVAHPGFPEIIHRFGDQAIGEMLL